MQCWLFCIASLLLATGPCWASFTPCVKIYTDAACKIPSIAEGFGAYVVCPRLEFQGVVAEATCLSSAVLQLNTSNPQSDDDEEPTRTIISTATNQCILQAEAEDGQEASYSYATCAGTRATRSLALLGVLIVLLATL